MILEKKNPKSWLKYSRNKNIIVCVYAQCTYPWEEKVHVCPFARGTKGWHWVSSSFTVHLTAIRIFKSCLFYAYE